MINTSTEFRKKMRSNDSRFLHTVIITLEDKTVLTVTDAEIWNDGLTIENAVSNMDSFDIGSTIISKCKLVLNNIYDDFSEYNFVNAKVEPYIGYEINGRLEMPQKGVFYVDEAMYNGSIITLNCYDGMAFLDRPYSESKCSYPATLYQILEDACNVCGLRLSASVADIPHVEYPIQLRPKDDNRTFRQVVGWVAQILCCYCRISRTENALELAWYDQDLFERVKYLDGGTFNTTTTPYSDGANLEGGNFNYNETEDYDGGDFISNDYKDIHHIYSAKSANISTDDVVITDVKIVEVNEKEDGKETTTEYRYTYKDGYVISIEGNDLIHNGASNNFKRFIGEKLVGFRFRKASLSHLSDPTIEAGDVGFYTDFKQNTYRILFSVTRYSSNGGQTSDSCAMTPSKNSDVRLAESTLNYLKVREEIRNKVSTLEERVNKTTGAYFKKVETPTGGSIYYVHDKPLLADSLNVWRLDGDTFAVTDKWYGDEDGNPGRTQWKTGMTSDGEIISKVISAIKIKAQDISTGTLTVGGTGTNTTNPTITIRDANNKVIGTIDSKGVDFQTGKISGATIEGSTIQGADIIVGGKNKTGGFVVYDANDELLAQIDYQGLSVYDGTISGAKIETQYLVGTDVYKRIEIENATMSFYHEEDKVTTHGYCGSISPSYTPEVITSIGNNELVVTEESKASIDINGKNVINFKIDGTEMLKLTKDGLFYKDNKSKYLPVAFVREVITLTVKSGEMNDKTVTSTKSVTFDRPNSGECFPTLVCTGAVPVSGLRISGNTLTVTWNASVFMGFNSWFKGTSEATISIFVFDALGRW